MTTIWLVETSDGECDHLSGVFSSREGAEEFVLLVPNPNDYRTDIREVGVDTQLALAKGKEGLWIVRFAPQWAGH